MTLYEKLQDKKSITSEEDVKDAYIKALGLTKYNKNLVDIQTKEIWFEAKEGYSHTTYEMFTQLLHYVKQATNEGEYVAPFLCVIDTRKAAIMRTEDAMFLINRKDIKWGKSASNYSQEALDAVSQYLGTYFISFNIKTHEAEFIQMIKSAIKEGSLIRTQITPNNLKQVFDKWVEMIGREIMDVEEDKYDQLFYADIMSDGTRSTHENLPAELIFKGGNPAFMIDGKLYELGNKEGYRNFWNIYERPPKEEYRNYLLERRDSLIPTNERAFNGDFYTPLFAVDKAYDYLDQALGSTWQKDYLVWDMCCGVGNLETKHSNHRKLFMSTLNQVDVDVMKATKTCRVAERFQYDYLNDDIAEDGTIDYTLTDKIPQELRNAIVAKKKILVLINPPYAEAMNADNTTNGSNLDDAEAKQGVSGTAISRLMETEGYAYAKRELFVQFLYRISKEIPNAVIAIFSKLKYVNADNFRTFRDKWRAEYLGGYIVHSKAFDGLKGNFPIGFLIWKTHNDKDNDQHRIGEIMVDVFDKKMNPIGQKKFFPLSEDQYLNKWINRLKSKGGAPSIPLKSAINPTDSTKDVRGMVMPEEAIASFMCNGNDYQHQKNTALLSAGYCSAGALWVTAENLWQVAIVFTVRLIEPATWVNDRDQFLMPTGEITDEFKNDCLIWMLFSNSNGTASADKLKWRNQDWSIVNHFIPFTEDELDASSRFESTFMIDYLEDKTLSAEATAVMNEGRKLWQQYFTYTDERSVREKYKLGRQDVGWYQVRNALKERHSLGQQRVDFSDFQSAYSELTDKLRKQIHSLGFIS